MSLLVGGLYLQYDDVCVLTERGTCQVRGGSEHQASGSSEM